MRKCLVILAGMMVVAVAMPATAFAGTPKVMGAGINLMKNGGFEKPVVAAGSFAEFTTGQTFKHWTVVGASGNVAVVSGTFTQAGFSFPAQSGNQWLDLTGTSNTPTGVSQTVANGLRTELHPDVLGGECVRPRRHLRHDEHRQRVGQRNARFVSHQLPTEHHSGVAEVQGALCGDVDLDPDRILERGPFE